MGRRILVTGATGMVGSGLVGELRGRGEHVRAAVHNPEKAAALEGDGIETVRFDWRDPATWDAAATIRSSP